VLSVALPLEERALLRSWQTRTVTPPRTSASKTSSGRLPTRCAATWTRPSKLLTGEIKARGRRNIVQARSFAEMLEEAIRRYQNRAVESAQVIEELIVLAEEMREASRRGEKLHLTEDEVAFYDALEVNDSAVKVLGDEALKAIARQLVEAVRSSVTLDWTMRENVRAKIRVMVKRILRMPIPHPARARSAPLADPLEAIYDDAARERFSQRTRKSLAEVAYFGRWNEEPA
jgi:hypothetical protein